MYGLNGKMIAHPGQRDVLIGYLLQAAAGMRNLEGCYIYIVSSAPDDENAIWVTEVWRSQADHQASLTLAGSQKLIALARPLIAGFSDRVEFVPVGGKGLPDNV